MLGIIKFEVNLLIKRYIRKMIKRDSIRRIGYYEYFGNKNTLRKYEIENCGATFMDGSIYILWDSDFYNSLSIQERTFCRLHELGHFTGCKNITELFTHERRLDEEVRADSYAVKRMGYMDGIVAMKQLLNHIEEYQKMEMNQRINIQKMMFDMTKYVDQYSAL